MGLRRRRGDGSRSPVPQEPKRYSDEREIDTTGLYTFNPSRLHVSRHIRERQYHLFHSYDHNGPAEFYSGSCGLNRGSGSTTDETLAHLRKCLEDAKARKQNLDRIQREVGEAITRIEEYKIQQPEQQS